MDALSVAFYVALVVVLVLVLAFVALEAIEDWRR